MIDEAYELRGRAAVASQYASTAIPGAERAVGAARVVEADLDRLAGSGTRPEITAHGLAKRLGVGSWLLHLHRFRHCVDGRRRDVAFALAGNTGAVYLQSIGESDEIDAWIATARPLEGERSTEAGLRLAGRLLGPLRSLAGLRPGDRLFLVPTGPWFAVPFGALPSPSGEGGPWIVHHEMVTLLDVSALSGPAGHDATTPTGPRIVGDPELDVGRLGESPGVTFPARPGLRAAAERAAAQLGAPAWTGDQATTAAVLHAPSPRALVVATYGYALPDSRAHGTRNGLAMAGALASLASAPGEDGVVALGWLSSEALSRADFSGTEVVDLSACALPEGAEVEVATTLARACRVAGARFVVLALGPVSDTGMVAFGQAFHQALAAGESPARAVRTAQIELSTRLDARAWGAFRCIGDGAPPPSAPATASLAPHDLAVAEVVVGSIHRHLGDNDSALGAYDRALFHDSRVAEAHYQRGRCLEKLERYAEAVRAYREAAMLEPADGAARYEIARLLLKDGQTSAAVEELVQLGRQFPGDRAVWRDLVTVRRQAKDWTAARQCAERWLAVDRNDDMAWHHYAAVLEALDEPQKALVARERTVELKPDHAAHWSNLGVHHARRGRFEQAEWSLRRATELDPAHSASWRNLAQVRLELGNASEAETAARSAIQRDEGHPAGHFLLGSALEALGRSAEARPSLERSAELGHAGAVAMLASFGASPSLKG